MEYQIKARLKWKTDLNKSVLIENFNERCWEELNDEDENWNMYWASVNNVRNIFNGKTFTKLNDNQLINHFPNYYELSRKDHMAKNIKKYKKQIAKDKNINADFMDFIPMTFILPGNYYI